MSGPQPSEAQRLATALVIAALDGDTGATELLLNLADIADVASAAAYLAKWLAGCATSPDGLRDVLAAALHAV